MKKFMKNVLGVGVIAGILASAGISMAFADYSGSYFEFRLDYEGGDVYDYSNIQDKDNDSYGLVYNYSGDGFSASMAGYDGSICEDIPMPGTYVEPYENAVKITNWVYENGYRQAVLRGESAQDALYYVEGTWSADQY